MNGERLRLVTPRGLLDLHVHGEDSPTRSAYVQLLRELWQQCLVDEGDVRLEDATHDVPVLTVTGPQTEITDPTSPSAPRRGDLAHVAYRASGEITRRILAYLVGTRMLLHSGVVDHDRHGVILLIGKSGAGKSTATRLLARSGRYLSDELAVIHPDTGAITPYPKPLSIANAPGNPKSDHTLASQGLTAGKSTAAPDHVLLLHRLHEEIADATAAPAQLRRLTLGEALPRIIAESSSMWRVPHPLERLARLLEKTGGALEATYREAEQLGELLEHVPPPHREAWTVIDPAPEASEARPDTGDMAAQDVAPVAPAHAEPRADAPEQLLTIAPFTQALATEDGVLVLSEESFTRMQGISALIWDILRADGPMDTAALEAAVLAELGPHPEASQLVAATLEEMRGASVLA